MPAHEQPANRYARGRTPSPPQRPDRDAVAPHAQSLTPTLPNLQRTIGNPAVPPPHAAVRRTAVDHVLASPGQPIAAPIRGEMEARLGADFSQVRVHTGSAARASADGVGARAYTVGSHVVIGGVGADRHVLAHELTHVIQQRQGSVAGTDYGSGLKISHPSDRDEQAADANAAQVMGALPREHCLASARTGEPGVAAPRRLADGASAAATSATTEAVPRHPPGGRAVLALQRMAGNAAGSEVVADQEPQLRFERFTRYGSLSNWGSYNDAEQELLGLEQELDHLVASRDPSLDRRGMRARARKKLDRLRSAAIPETEYETTKKDLGKSIEDLRNRQLRERNRQTLGLRGLVRNAAPVDAKKLIDENLKQILGHLDGERRQERVDELRQHIDNVPDYFGEQAVNTAHAALNAYDRQVGVPGVSYLAPSRTSHGQVEHVINRGISEVVTIEGKVYTPVYVTVFGSALTGSEPPKHKDVGEDLEGRIQIHTGGGKNKENVFWMSIGRPLRQVKWLENYKGQGAKEPLIRSFLIPLEIADKIAADPLTEYKTTGLGRDLNVDKHFEANQYGIVSAESMEALRRHALPGSLRTYTDATKQQQVPGWGEVRSAGELRERLGVPEKAIPDYPIFVKKDKAEFSARSDYGKQIDRLTRIYAYWTGNPLFLPKDENGQPHKMPPADVRQQAVDGFFRKYGPPELQKKDAGLDEFMREYVAPWATQAQVAETIAENYDALSGDKKLPPQAPSVQFTPPLPEPLRGQRRSKALELSQEQIKVLESRRKFQMELRKARGLLTNAFPEDAGKKTRQTLGEIQKLIKDVEADYQFSIGDVSAIKQRLPEYKKKVEEQLKVLSGPRPAEAKRPITDALIESLKSAVDQGIEVAGQVGLATDE